LSSSFCRFKICGQSQTEHAAQQGLAADNRQLGVPELSSICASGFCGMALAVSAVYCS
jgi:hypothetical protein